MSQRWWQTDQRRSLSTQRSRLEPFPEHSLLLPYVTGSGCPEGLRADCAWEARYSSTEEWQRGGHRGVDEWSLSLLTHITTPDCLEFHTLDLQCRSHCWPDMGGRIYGKLQVSDKSSSDNPIMQLQWHALNVATLRQFILGLRLLCMLTTCRHGSYHTVVLPPLKHSKSRFTFWSWDACPLLNSHILLQLTNYSVHRQN